MEDRLMKVMRCPHRNWIADSFHCYVYCKTVQRGSLYNCPRGEMFGADIRGKMPVGCPDTNFTNVSDFNSRIIISIQH